MRTIENDPVPASVELADCTLTYIQVNRQGAPLTQAGEPHDRAFHSGMTVSDRYRIEKTIGRGGMGEVYLARDLRLDRPVAIKVIRGDHASFRANANTEQAAAFEREAKIGAGLVHPAIATVHDYGFHDDVAFTVFEYVAGESLGQLIRRKAPMSLDDVRLIIASLAQALDYAHSCGIIHRDLKPENVRFTEQGQPKILDLGLALRFLETTHWGFAGTPAYASPEQAAEAPSDGRTDQYALALIAYEMLAGRRAFQATGWQAMLDMHRTELAAPLKTLLPDLPTEVDEAILRALRKDPNQRFSSCEEFAAAIGCHFRSDANRSDAIRREAAVTVRDPRPWKELSFRVSRNSPGILAVQSDQIWILRGERIDCWPSGGVRQVRVAGKRLSLDLCAGGVRRKHRLLFRTSSECADWATDLRASIGSRDPEIADGWTPDRPTAVLLQGRPDVSYQILGSVEAKASSKNASLRRLRLEATIRRADAVIDVRRERIVNIDRTYWRSTGTAVSTIDSAGRSELVTRWFGDEVARLSKWTIGLVLVFFVARLIGTFVFGGMQFDRIADETSPRAAARLFLQSGALNRAIFSMVFMHAWPLLAACWLWYTRIPQLARATALAVLGLALPPVVFLVATPLFCLVFRSVPDLTTFTMIFSIFDPVNLGLLCFVWIMTHRLWRSVKTLRAALPKSMIQISRPRRLAGGIAVTASAGFLLALVALGLFQSYVIAQPQLLRLGLGAAALQSGDLDAATSMLHSSIEQSPTAAAHSDLAWIELSRGNHAACVEQATKAIDLDSSLAVAYVNRAAGYLGLGKLQSALDDCNRALELDPKSGLAYVNRTAVYIRLGDVERAKDDAERAIELLPTAPEARQNYEAVQLLTKNHEAVRLCNLAMTELSGGNLEKCVQAATKSIELDPTIAVAYVNRSAGFLGLGQTQSAIDDCNRALAIDANCALAYINRSTAYIRLENRQLALADAKKALSLAPDHPMAKKNSEMLEAIVDLKALNLSDQSVRELQVGNVQKCIELATQAIELAPEFAMPYANRAVARLSLGDAQSALDDCNRAIELDTEFAMAHLNRSLAHMMLGQPQSAFDDARRAVELEPSNALAQQHLENMKSMLDSDESVPSE